MTGRNWSRRAMGGAGTLVGMRIEIDVLSAAADGLVLVWQKRE